MQRFPLWVPEGRGRRADPRHWAVQNTAHGFSHLPLCRVVVQFSSKLTALSTWSGCPLAFAEKVTEVRNEFKKKKKLHWMTCNFRKKNKVIDSKGKHPVEFIYSSLNSNEIPCNESNDLRTVQAHCSCTPVHMAGGCSLGRVGCLSLGPQSKGTDSAVDQWHIPLPPETPMPTSIEVAQPGTPPQNAGDKARQETKRQSDEMWQFCINLCKQTVP